MRDRVCYECADLHLVPLKGKCHMFALVKLHKVKSAKSPSAMISKNSHPFSLIACICQSLHLTESPDENRQNAAHFVMKSYFLMQSRLY